MKTVLVGINSKYIHPNLAIRYLKANSDYPTTIKEFNIKDNIEYIYNNILEDNPEIIAFSVYIWNVSIIKELLEKFKQSKKSLIIIGGPEVSYDDSYLLNGLTDYIIVNEGEIAFNKLLESIHLNQSPESVPNLKYLHNQQIIQTHKEDILDLNNLHNPYKVIQDNYENKIAYVELSRGCPYRCSYCMASLENGVRFFNIDTVKEQLTYLYQRGARTFKFLDRTFNIREELALSLFKYIFTEEFHEAIFQFEINADILTSDLIDFLNRNCPPNKIRFEIGIQSTNIRVNKAVNRNQDIQKLLENIRLLKNGNVILHLDLIAGLPFEDLSSFKNTFNETYKLYGEELQLGFLKMLRGTQLYEEIAVYDYIIDEKSPYELLSNRFLSSNDIKKIHIVESALNVYWNKGFMNSSMYHITKLVESPFDFFYELGQFFLSRNHEFHRYQLEDVFSTLEAFVKDEDLVSLVRYDYLVHSKIKPKVYWDNKIQKNDIIRKFHSQNKDMNIDNLYKYSLVTKYLDSYLIVLYFPDGKQIYKIKA